MISASWLREKVGRLLSLKDPPQAIAVGMAVGVFFGVIPLLGVKTLLALAVTRLLRGSIVAAGIAVAVHDGVFPVVALLLRWGYDVRYWVLCHPPCLPPRRHMSP